MFAAVHRLLAWCASSLASAGLSRHLFLWVHAVALHYLLQRVTYSFGLMTPLIASLSFFVADSFIPSLQRTTYVGKYLFPLVTPLFKIVKSVLTVDSVMNMAAFFITWTPIWIANRFLPFCAEWALAILGFILVFPHGLVFKSLMSGFGLLITVLIYVAAPALFFCAFYLVVPFSVLAHLTNFAICCLTLLVLLINRHAKRQEGSKQAEASEETNQREEQETTGQAAREEGGEGGEKDKPDSQVGDQRKGEKETVKQETEEEERAAQSQQEESEERRESPSSNSTSPQEATKPSDAGLWVFFAFWLYYDVWRRSFPSLTYVEGGAVLLSWNYYLVVGCLMSCILLILFLVVGVLAISLQQRLADKEKTRLTGS